MHLSIVFPTLALLSSAEAAETLLGAYIFHRHGDRTPKALAPANLTSLGYDQVYTSGQYFRSRFLSNSSSKIYKLNSDVVKLSQISVTAPVDNVLQNSAMGFLQGLYPPVGEELNVQTLSNGSKVQTPMNGYQLIPVNAVAQGSGSEDSGWLQDASGCENAELSSNNYFSSSDYTKLLNSTKGFYEELVPVVNATFDPSYVTFKNAYIVYDLINVATIHNTSIPSNATLTPGNLLQTRTLADAHEWGLAYNVSDDMRAMAGMQLAGEILKYMNSTITSGSAGLSSNKLGIQFGAYASFFSFFGLASLPAANPDFMGIPDYASSMVFELFTDAAVPSDGFPATSDLQVRFSFHNGTASNFSEPVAYPLFGGKDLAISWNSFADSLSKFAVTTTQDWCTKCGNTTGTCAPYASSTPAPSSTAKSSGGHSGISAAVGGVIGAFVTLAVILGTLAAAMLIGGLRVVSKKRLAGGSPAVEGVATGKA
ncbi:phosphoglycerate mutase-like protein [Mytilinidion resinicola]|uniref:Phosphoglycerate mutase-like protein n=1 Tax=Mytilinidion resinicola TaxID=574789 RepID=A0A6A6YTB0_9PEZI|nr:phosphoglycerate mutase-like protein [Mytilinidion resinicola]KAF2811195.1 phosphoglycerate mutase-like protein [Mytilinidion resinicola]